MKHISKLYIIKPISSYILVMPAIIQKGKNACRLFQICVLTPTQLSEYQVEPLISQIKCLEPVVQWRLKSRLGLKFRFR